ncbi:hypothetical protein HAHE_30010 [Haloferula helveola]|uniref:Uncharacterized protein n=1 Tax=Haloferula helveola TaxID=490095 RepID=A0ABN6H7F8_9BACT|nr:hypothetical protein HAHE_30010 [Haloferula helveola]
MKTSQWAAVPAAIAMITCAIISSGPALAQSSNAGGSKKADPLYPVGSLDAYPTLVQTGTHPTLTWAIQYPETFEEILRRDGVCMELRVLGAPSILGYQSNGKPNYAYVQAEVNIGDGNWVRFFYDTHEWVQPNWTYATAKTIAGVRPHFRGRVYNNGWLPYQTTGTGSPEAVALTAGDPLPQYVPAIQRGEIASFLQPYVDAGGYVKIGPKEQLILFELETTDRTSPKYDMQDLVILATADYCKNNNGHGNNWDGVDVSNPGNGRGGPNSEEDPSGEIDDEKK